jgi:hypothetical protein
VRRGDEVDCCGRLPVDGRPGRDGAPLPGLRTPAARAPTGFITLGTGGCWLRRPDRAGQRAAGRTGSHLADAGDGTVGNLPKRAQPAPRAVPESPAPGSRREDCPQCLAANQIDGPASSLSTAHRNKVLVEDCWHNEAFAEAGYGLPGESWSPLPNEYAGDRRRREDRFCGPQGVGGAEHPPAPAGRHGPAVQVVNATVRVASRTVVYTGIPAEPAVERLARGADLLSRR